MRLMSTKTSVLVVVMIAIVIVVNNIIIIIYKIVIMGLISVERANLFCTLMLNMFIL